MNDRISTSVFAAFVVGMIPACAAEPTPAFLREVQLAYGCAWKGDYV
jgi:hypothetical protein